MSARPMADDRFIFQLQLFRDQLISRKIPFARVRYVRAEQEAREARLLNLWRRFWKPSLKYAAGPLIVVGFLLGALFWGGFNWTVEATSSNEFCLSCHELRDNVYEHYAQSSHYSNVSGIRVGCADCHVPQDLVGKVRRKLQGINEIYHHFAGTISTPEKFEANRARMAQKVWATFEANDSATCRTCHSFDAMTIAAQSAEAQKNHPVAIEEGDTCISCHKGLVHKMPDLSSGYIQMFEAMRETAQAEGGRADTLYPISEKPIFSEAGAVDPDARGVGRLLAATELSVLERQGDALRVRVDGWRQQGVDRVIYKLMGHRIFSVVLTPAAVEGVEVHETRLDEATDLTWERVSHDFWVANTDLIADVDTLWEYGAEMNQAACSTCHRLAEPEHFLANQWIGVLKSMERFVSLDKEQTRMLQKYLQVHAKDTGGRDAIH